MLEFSHRKDHLRLEAVERNDDDFILEARVRVGYFTARHACNVLLDELETWRIQLQGLYDTLSGEAVLRQPGFRIVVSGDGTGHVTVEGELDSDNGWGHGERAVLQFALPRLDQSYLPAAIAWVDGVVVMEQATGGCREE